MTTLPISDIVRINTIISPVSPPSEQRRTLVLTTDTTLDAGGAGKVKSYANLAEVARDFATTSEAYRAAQTYFAQVPFPRELVVGRWQNNATTVNTQIRGGAPSDVGEISGSAVNDYSINVAGVDVTGITVAANAAYAAIAGAVQSAMQGFGGGLSAATCSFAGGRFTIEVPPTTRVVALPTDAAEGTPIAGLLGLNSETGATLHVGAAQETIAEALDAILGLDGAIYFIVLEKTLNDSDAMVAASTWAQANKVFLSIETNTDPLIAAAQRDTLVAVEPRRALMTASLFEDYKAASAVARLSSVDYTAPNSVTTLKFRTLPNTAPDSFNRSQVRALQENDINFYVRYGGLATYAEGVMMDGGWADELAWLDWFTTAVEREVFGLLRRMPKVPLTNVGLLQLRNTVQGPCRQGLANGGLAPNRVSDELAGVIRQATGDTGFDGYLSTGYLIAIPPITSLTQSQRDNRELPAFSIFGKGAGAVHGFVANFTFER